MVMMESPLPPPLANAVSPAKPLPKSSRSAPASALLLKGAVAERTQATSAQRDADPAVLPLAFRLARRELRGGLKGFGVFLACLALGVAAIAAVGSVRMAISEGLSQEGQAILGGDAELEFTYRFAEPEERAWMERVSERVSETVDFRSMAVAPKAEGAERALTQVKGVDGAWPLYGAAEFSGGISQGDALGLRDGVWGLVMAPALIDRLGLAVGDRVRLGRGEYELRAALEVEPDAAAGGSRGDGEGATVLTLPLERAAEAAVRVGLRSALAHDRERALE